MQSAADKPPGHSDLGKPAGTWLGRSLLPSSDCLHSPRFPDPTPHLPLPSDQAPSADQGSSSLGPPDSRSSPSTTGKISLPGIPTHRQDHPSGGCSQNTQHRSPAPVTHSSPFVLAGCRHASSSHELCAASQKTFRRPAHHQHANRRQEVPGEMGGNGGLGPKGTPKMLRQTPVEPIEAAVRHPRLGVASMQTPNACHGLRGARETSGAPQRPPSPELFQWANACFSRVPKGVPTPTSPPALALTATGTRDSPASCSPPHGGQWACRPHPVTPYHPPPIPWAGPALSPSAQLSAPQPS